MTDKELKDYCGSCSVEPPAMRLKCPECEHNPDKEQIIIDDVDVVECKHYERHSFYDCNETCEDNGAIVCTNCEDNPNCYFKQHARKTQECRQKDEVIEELMRERQELQKQLRHQLDMDVAMHKECEELKRDVKERRLASRQMRDSLCQEVSQKLRLLEALEEIEEVYETAMGSVTTYDEQADLNITIEALHDISDIINKAKREE